MIRILSIVFTVFSLSAFGQKSPTEKARPIVEEGKLLYKSEMASWYGTDLFIAKYSNRSNIGGYFSYSEGDTIKCIFFASAEDPTVIGTVSFDSTYNVNTAPVDLDERDFTPTEKDLYEIRKLALIDLQKNEDEFYQFYQNTNPNFIPLINGDEKKVYILTGPTQNGVVIFGNDYLLEFDSTNKLKSKNMLHRNLIPIEYGNLPNGAKSEIAMHSHTKETGEFITATDICTLMLYSEFAGWKSHNVISEKYMNTWNCETNELIVVPMNEIEKINKDQKKREKKK
ncbi:hypothetical protein O3Q51_14560 [Cryomorphaceae bacterium 1068]|nr:hypothetical protein [Cryomorphaceae bacterium 1068]